VTGATGQTGDTGPSSLGAANNSLNLLADATVAQATLSNTSGATASLVWNSTSSLANGWTWSSGSSVFTLNSLPPGAIGNTAIFVMNYSITIQMVATSSQTPAVGIYLYNQSDNTVVNGTRFVHQITNSGSGSMAYNSSSCAITTVSLTVGKSYQIIATNLSTGTIPTIIIRPVSGSSVNGFGSSLSSLVIHPI
jgi:hypothetical protein